MLPLAERIGEAEVNELDVLFLDHRENLFRVHISSVPLFCGLRLHAPKAAFSYGGVTALASTNSDGVVYARHEYLAVTDEAGVHRAADTLDRLSAHLILA